MKNLASSDEKMLKLVLGDTLELPELLPLEVDRLDVDIIYFVRIE